jgi:hypothetical protein
MPNASLSIKQGATTIPSGGSYSFGSILQGSGNVRTVFDFDPATLLGGAEIETSGASSTLLVISGSGAAAFSAKFVDQTTGTDLPEQSNFFQGGPPSHFFRITLSSVTAGAFTATFTLRNIQINYAQVADYTFTITGTVTAPVTGSNGVIGNGIIGDDGGV